MALVHDAIEEDLPETLIGDGPVYVAPAQLRVVVHRVRAAFARVFERIERLEGAPRLSNRSDSNPDAPDIVWNDKVFKLFLRSLMLADKGDTPDLALRAVGPVGSGHDGPSEAWPNDTNIANIYWQAMGSDGLFSPAAAQVQSRAAIIYARTAEPPTATGRGAKVGIGTCPVGSIYAQEAVVVEPDGTLNLVRGNGQRIRADFSSGDANRCFFQTSGTNAPTVLAVKPAGVGATTGLDLYSSADVANAGIGRFRINAGSISIDSTSVGTGTVRPIVLSLGGVERIRLDTTGIGFFGGAPAAKRTVTGSRGGNAALASLLTALAAYGLITDSTTA